MPDRGPNWKYPNGLPGASSRFEMLRDAYPGKNALIIAIFAELPPAGSVWPEEDRQDWFHCLECILRLIYKTEPPAKKSEVTSEARFASQCPTS